MIRKASHRLGKGGQSKGAHEFIRASCGVEGRFHGGIMTTTEIIVSGKRFFPGVELGGDNDDDWDRDYDDVK